MFDTGNNAGFGHKSEIWWGMCFPDRYVWKPRVSALFPPLSRCPFFSFQALKSLCRYVMRASQSITASNALAQEHGFPRLQMSLWDTGESHCSANRPHHSNRKRNVLASVRQCHVAGAGHAGGCVSPNADQVTCPTRFGQDFGCYEKGSLFYVNSKFLNC